MNQERKKTLWEMVQEELQKKVGWVVFTWAIGIVFLLFSIVIMIATNASAKAEDTADRVGSVEGDLKAIKSDVGWLRGYVEQQSGMIIKK